MAIYRNVHLSFWEDSKIVDELTPEERYFFLYILTNPHTNLIGCYEISLKQIVNEVGYDQKDINDMLNNLEKKYNLILYSKNTKEILIKNWYKYNWTKSNKLIKPILNEIKKIKSEELKKYMVNIGYIYGIDTTDTVSDTDTDNNIFKKPNIKDIENYCNERNNNINPNNFFDFYESKNWMVGKNKMKDWEAAIRTWENRNKKNGTQVPKWMNEEIKSEQASQQEIEEIERLLEGE